MTNHYDKPAPTRPMLRYHGGKWRLAHWLMQFFPPHEVYVEPFAGAGSVLMQKPRAKAECLNDLDDRIVSVYRVLRNPAKAIELRRRLELTPFARSEFEAVYTEAPVDDIDMVRALIMLSFMGHGSDSIGRGYRTGFRGKFSNGRNFPSGDWANWPEQIPLFLNRLRGVLIEHRDALEVIDRLDRDSALFYVDPPYPMLTRTAARGRHGYRHELSDDQHRSLAEMLHGVRGMVVISGYPCALYDQELYAGWERHERPHLADGARPRTEVVWLNPACSEALLRQRGVLGLETSA